MGKRRLLTGVISGAVIGGVISLFNEDARGYAKHKLCATRETASKLLDNPAETVRSVKQSIEELNDRITVGAENSVNALEQVENTLEKVTNRIG